MTDLMNVTKEDMNKAVENLQTERGRASVVDFLTVLYGIISGDYMVLAEEDRTRIINEFSDRYDEAYWAGYEEAMKIANTQVNEAYWQGYNEAREAYDGTSDDDYEEPEDLENLIDPDDVDDDFGFDPYMGCYTYDC